jgi:hypothetical protein
VNSRPWIQPGNDGPAPRTECAFVREHLPALALGALDTVDREEVEHHLRWCDGCRLEATSYESVANLLPLGLPGVAGLDPAIKSSLLDRIARDDDAPRPTMAVPDASGPEPPAAPAPQRHLSWTRFVPAALVAPLAVALLVVGAWANSLRNDLDNAAPETTVAAAVTLQGREVQTYAVERSCDTCIGSGQFGLSEADSMGMVVGWDFDPAQEHEVWGITHTGERKKVCELYVDPAGSVMQTFNLPEKPSGLTEIYITDAAGNLIYVVHIGEVPAETPAETTSIH